MEKNKVNYTIKGCNKGGVRIEHCSFISSVDIEKDARTLNDFLKQQVPSETRKEFVKLIIQQNMEKIIIED